MHTSILYGSLINFRFRLDAGGHLVRTLLCHLPSVAVASLANASARVQTDCADLAVQSGVHVAHSLPQPADTDE